jgi:hypothetical protein
MQASRSLMAVLLASGAVCAAATVQPPGPVPWSPERRLQWADFLAPPQSETPAAALTVYELQTRSSCETGTRSFRVTTQFLPGLSWSRPDKRADRTLAHEQAHFDLGEVTARRLRRALDALQLSCDEPEARFLSVVAQFQQQDAAQQRSYDRQTMYGTDAEAQLTWERRIALWLKDDQ